MPLAIDRDPRTTAVGCPSSDLYPSGSGRSDAPCDCTRAVLPDRRAVPTEHSERRVPATVGRRQRATSRNSAAANSAHFRSLMVPSTSHRRVERVVARQPLRFGHRSPFALSMTDPPTGARLGVTPCPAPDPPPSTRGRAARRRGSGSGRRRCRTRRLEVRRPGSASRRSRATSYICASE